MVVMLGVKYIEVEPIARVLQELAIKVGQNVCPLIKATTKKVWVVPHGFKLSFSQLIVGLVIYKDHIAFAKGARVDMGVKM